MTGPLAGGGGVASPDRGGPVSERESEQGGQHRRPRILHRPCVAARPPARRNL